MGLRHRHTEPPLRGLPGPHLPALPGSPKERGQPLQVQRLGAREDEGQAVTPSCQG